MNSKKREGLFSAPFYFKAVGHCGKNKFSNGRKKSGIKSKIEAASLTALWFCCVSLLFFAGGAVLKTCG